ncbi:MAG TPA: hypothetical protein VGY56_04075 [Verrucomicrobiae bacterium]|nr:hypothetical protein [Verrucomicrobiae bacterium]
MEIVATDFWLPKNGSSEAEYEDASAIAEGKLRFAVADGATETSFSKIWAKQLVRAFVDGRLSIPIVTDELGPLQSRWQKIVHRHPLPWYAEEKASDGAFAAFVGLQFFDARSETDVKTNWRAAAAGDSCLFQLRDGKIVESFPLEDSGSFNDRPNLLGSVANGNGSLETMSRAGGPVFAGDVFFLMTDAIACWFLKEHERGNKPWDLLQGQDQSSFRDLVTNLRAEKEMKNDDVTLVRIDFIA